MQFVSWGFLLFLPVVVLLNFIIPRKYRYIWLFVTSAFFYLSLDLKAVAVMAVSVVLTYFEGILLGRLLEGKSVEGKKNGAGEKVLLAASIAVDVVLLLVFRAGSILGAIGISFYMLKAIGYLVDVYRGDVKAEKNFIKLALFVSFFTQVVSGPIERAGNMLPQFSYPVTVDFYRLRDGLLQMLWGYILKLVIADRLAIFVNSVYGSPADYPGTIVFIGTLFYTFEIYCDFAGYSHIAIGASRILGIDVIQNFDSPYMSASIAEFWRRWHISLSSWLRDYIYIPLGGNRKGVVRKYINILIVFSVSGIWHGTALTFLVWGILHALYQIIGYVLKPARDKLVEILKIDRNSFSHRMVKVVITFLLVNFAWIFFRADSLSTALLVIRKCFEFTPWVYSDGSIYKLGLNSPNFILANLGILGLAIADFISYRDIELREKLLAQGFWLRWIVVIIGVLLVFICGIWGPGYDAATFIYQQF